MFVFQASYVSLGVRHGDYPQLRTLPRSAPFLINKTAASPCPDSIARWSGVFPTLSCVFTRVFARTGAGKPAGGIGGSRRSEMKEVEPIVAARCKGHWLALSLAFIYKCESLD